MIDEQLKLGSEIWYCWRLYKKNWPW